MPLDQAGSRFSAAGQSGIAAGLQESSTLDPFNKKFIRRNLKPYKGLKKFAKKGGLKGLRGKNTAQLESMAAKAVLKKNKVKSKPLSTKVRKGQGKGQFTGKQLRRARRHLKRQGPENDFQAGSNKYIKRKGVRRAANHLRQIRRNRRVNKTPVGSKRAYDIYKGYTRR
jgi:hypothetical protein